MENNKKSVPLVLFVIALIVIAVMAYFLYEAYNKIADDKDKENTTSVTNTAETTNETNLTSKDLQETNTAAVNTDTNTTNNTTTTTKTVDNVMYVELKNKLDKDEVLYITDAIKNNDKTYTLKGLVYTRFVMTKDELENLVAAGTYTYKDEELKVVKKDKKYEFYGKWNDEERLNYVARLKENDTYYIENTTENSAEWRMTNEHKTITVSKDLKVKCDGKTVTVDKKFKDFKPVASEESYPPTPAYTFEFKKEKCERINELILGY